MRTLHTSAFAHGFSLGDFDIDETIGKRETKVIEFYARGKGKQTFRCSHFCGLGHFGIDR